MKQKILLLTAILLFSVGSSFAEFDQRSVEKYALKGGYTLVFNPVQEKDESYTIHSTKVYVKYGNDMLLIAENDGGSDNIPGLSKYFYRYEGVDFDDYFVITLFGGGWEHFLYEKKSGKLVLRWENSDSKAIADLQNNFLIFNDDKRGKAYLLDLKTMKQYLLNPYLDAEQERVTLWGTNWWTNAFEFVAADSKKVTLSFSGFYKPVFDESGEVVDSEDYSFTFDVEL